MMLTAVFLNYVSLGEEKSPDPVDAKQDVSSNAEQVKSCLKEKVTPENVYFCQH